MQNEKINVTAIRAVMMYGTYPDKLHRVYDVHNNMKNKNELIYILKGTHKVHFNGVEGIETDDCVRFLPKGNYPPGTLYTTDKFEYSSDDRSIDIFFDTDKPLSNELFIMSFEKDRTVRMLFEKIYQIWYQKHDGYYYKCMSILYEILEKLEKARANYLPKEKYELIKPALDYIDAHFREGNIDCDYLAELCEISHSYLNRIFVKRFGMSPLKFINEKRIAFACDMLVSKRYSIKEIAAAVGYENIYHFSKAFKQLRGVSPSAYSKKATL